MSTIQKRCPACQLQLCKSREEPPHSDLITVAADPPPSMKPLLVGDTAYTCQKCGTTLINSNDRAEIGWRKVAA